MYETCFKDRGIDRLCVKHVSRIGVLIEVPFVIPSIILSYSRVFFEEGGEGSFIKWSF